MRYFFDENNIRYTLLATNGGEPFNWIFLPGGPGADSSLLSDLAKSLSIPGNIWLIDMPGNGSHNVQIQDFDVWLELFIPMLKKFEHPIVVGHSFGGMLPLLFPECEEILRGFVVLNSSPKLWLDAAAKYAKEHHLPDLTPQLTEFIKNPNQDTCQVVLDACTPYYFPKRNLEMGRKMLKQLPFAYGPAVWWQRKSIEMEYDAKWIPQNVNTLIVGAEFDAITPWSLFNNDPRFDRGNVTKVFIHDAGHLPWIEKPHDVANAFDSFIKRIRK